MAKEAHWWDGADWRQGVDHSVWDGSAWQDVLQLHIWDGSNWQHFWEFESPISFVHANCTATAINGTDWELHWELTGDGTGFSIGVEEQGGAEFTRFFDPATTDTETITFGANLTWDIVLYNVLGTEVDRVSGLTP